MSKVLQEILTENVLRGAALLDEKDPGWAHKIDLDGLEMHSCQNCILGQRFKSYRKGNEALGLDWEDDSDIQHGFELPMAASNHDWPTLEDIWREQIMARRAAKAGA